MRHEHVNNFLEIESLLRIIFKKVNKRHLGMSGHLSLYQFFECSDPILEACQKFSRI
jgi:hypothetical protein